MPPNPGAILMRALEESSRRRDRENQLRSRERMARYSTNADMLTGSMRGIGQAVQGLARMDIAGDRRNDEQARFLANMAIRQSGDTRAQEMHDARLTQMGQPDPNADIDRQILEARLAQMTAPPKPPDPLRQRKAELEIAELESEAGSRDAVTAIGKAEADPEAGMISTEAGPELDFTAGDTTAVSEPLLYGKDAEARRKQKEGMAESAELADLRRQLESKDYEVPIGATRKEMVAMFRDATKPEKEAPAFDDSLYRIAMGLTQDKTPEFVEPIYKDLYERKYGGGEEATTPEQGQAIDTLTPERQEYMKKIIARVESGERPASDIQEQLDRFADGSP